MSEPEGGGEDIDIAVLFSEAEIEERISALSGDIVRDLGSDFIVVGLLKGAFVFVADLMRALHGAGAAPKIEFMRLSSYGLGKVSAGEVHLLGDIPTDLAGQTVLLVDDIVDTGRSLAYAQALLQQRDVVAIKTCALIDKPSRREVETVVDYVGFAVPDRFIAGYGIDYAERYRYLPFIGAVD